MPYNVSLVAYNEFGKGRPVEVTVFTRVLSKYMCVHCSCAIDMQSLVYSLFCTCMSVLLIHISYSNFPIPPVSFLYFIFVNFFFLTPAPSVSPSGITVIRFADGKNVRIRWNRITLASMCIMSNHLHMWFECAFKPVLL